MQGLGHLKNVSTRTENDSSRKDEQMSVNIARLDDLHLANVTAIKIDVEGAEREVLLGSIETIKRWKPLLYCELWNDDRRSGTLEMFESLGYAAYILSESGEMVLFDRTSNGYVSGENFIFKTNGKGIGNAL